ncbi:RNA-binding protein [Candidatus Bathyarchaeota archaeon]|nr:RNA-binding protein [Candidatus Bathyarchaeota archaeon]MBS7636687.1 RNA-binding protein [Candidatus Bathyarchaeota archaeon]
MQRKSIAIAIPASVVSDIPHLREKTSKIGLIGRAAAIFGVGEIIIYKDELKLGQRAEMDLIATLLNYMETPQYLRKKLFKLKPELRYAGTLPPLRTPHHPLGKKAKELKEGEYREGVTVAKSGKNMFVDIGVDKLALIPNVRLPLKKRVTVKITGVNRYVTASLANRGEVPHYWGYNVTLWDDSFGRLVAKRLFDLKIATSKYGVFFPDVVGKIAERWRKSEKILIAFGAPTKGLYEIVKLEGLNLDQIVDFVVNTIPGQLTETVRTEEALIATLAVFNCAFGFKV